MSGIVWSKFFWSDWESDQRLRLCSLEAQGLWMRVLCVCAQSERGAAEVDGVALSDEKLAKIVGTSARTFRKLIAELGENGVISRDENGAIFSRRLRRDAEKRKQDQDNGRKGGNPALKEGVNPPDAPKAKGEDKAHKPEANSQKPESKPNGLEARSRATRIQDDWSPGEDGTAYAAEKGFTATEIHLTAERFRNYWRAKSGKDATKRDWAATWRNWVLNELDRKPTQLRPKRVGFV